MTKELEEAIECLDDKETLKYIDKIANSVNPSKALDDLFDLVTCQGSFEKGQKCYDILEEAITELKAIKEANSSEAMECLRIIENNIIYLLNDCDINDEIVCNFKYLKSKMPTIEKALLKAQEQEKEINALKSDLEEQSELAKYYLEEQEKVLRIIKEKGIDIGWLRQCKTVEEYNYHCEAKRLTQDEFDLLKEMV